MQRILLQHLGPLPERAEKLSEVSQASTVNSSLQAASKSSLQQDDEEQEIPFDGVSLTQVNFYSLPCSLSFGIIITALYIN